MKQYNVTNRTFKVADQTVAEVVGPDGIVLFIPTRCLEAMMSKLDFVGNIDDMVAYQNDLLAGQAEEDAKEDARLAAEVEAEERAAQSLRPPE
jgi:hypothetical protein